MAKVSAYDSYFRVNKLSGSVTVVRVRRGEPAPTGPQFEVWPAPRMSDAKKRDVLKGLRAEAKTVADGWVLKAPRGGGRPVPALTWRGRRALARIQRTTARRTAGLRARRWAWAKVKRGTFSLGRLAWRGVTAAAKGLARATVRAADAVAHALDERAERRTAARPAPTPARAPQVPPPLDPWERWDRDFGSAETGTARQYAVVHAHQREGTGGVREHVRQLW